jgi:hypothetical protein
MKMKLTNVSRLANEHYTHGGGGGGGDHNTAGEFSNQFLVSRYCSIVGTKYLREFCVLE